MTVGWGDFGGWGRPPLDMIDRADWDDPEFPPRWEPDWSQPAWAADVDAPDNLCACSHVWERSCENCHQCEWCCGLIGRHVDSDGDEVGIGACLDPFSEWQPTMLTVEAVWQICDRELAVPDRVIGVVWRGTPVTFATFQTLHAHPTTVWWSDDDLAMLVPVWRGE